MERRAGMEGGQPTGHLLEGGGPFFKTGGPGAGKMLMVELTAADGGTTGFWRRLAAEAQTRAGGTCPGAGGGGAPGPLV